MLAGHGYLYLILVNTMVATKL